MATPTTPNLGAPNNPKMNTAFKMMFNTNASALRAVLTATCPMLRSTAR